MPVLHLFSTLVLPQEVSNTCNYQNFQKYDVFELSHSEQQGKRYCKLFSQKVVALWLIFTTTCMILYDTLFYFNLF